MKIFAFENTEGVIRRYPEFFAVSPEKCVNTGSFLQWELIKLSLNHHCAPLYNQTLDNLEQWLNSFERDKFSTDTFLVLVVVVIIIIIIIIIILYIYIYIYI